MKHVDKYKFFKYVFIFHCIRTSGLLDLFYITFHYFIDNKFLKYNV